jgi:hypothetical protein
VVWFGTWLRFNGLDWRGQAFVLGERVCGRWGGRFGWVVGWRWGVALMLWRWFRFVSMYGSSTH